MSRRRAAMIVCGALALLALPGHEFPWIWLVVLTMPAVGLSFSLTRWPAATKWVATSAGAVQITAMALVAGTVPLSTIASLGCTLIPPLAYSIARAHSTDCPRAVFLAFCLVVIASILGQPDSLLVLGWLVASLMVLLLDVESRGKERRASYRSPPPRFAARFADIGRLSLGGILVCVLVLRSLAWLPPLGGAERSAAGEAEPTMAGSRSSATVGPSHSFEFGDRAGSPIALRSSELIAVSSLDSHPVPGDLYLRSGAFELAGMDKWRSSPGSRQQIRGRTRLTNEHPRAIKRIVAVDCLEATDLAFVPAGTFMVEETQDLALDRRRAVFTHTAPRIGNAIVAHFQSLHHVEIDGSLVQSEPGFVALPNEITKWREQFAPLLSDPRVGNARSPFEIAEAIGDAIRERCTYVLAEPTGPYAHSILNFLGGSRTGFCMHFASTTAIALRMLGVPCRIGVGVYGGEPSSSDPHTRIFGAQHAHAWVEIPTRAGFVVYDPTPPSIRPLLRWPEFAELERDSAADDAANSAQATASNGEFLDRLDPRFLLVALAVIGLVPFFRRNPRGDGAVAVIAIAPAARRAERLMHEVLVEAARAGLARRPHETLERWSAEHAGESECLSAAVLAYQEVRFGDRPLDKVREQLLRSAGDRMRELQAQRSIVKSTADDSDDSSRTDTLSTREKREPL